MRCFGGVSNKKVEGGGWEQLGSRKTGVPRVRWDVQCLQLFLRGHFASASGTCTARSPPRPCVSASRGASEDLTGGGDAEGVRTTVWWSRLWSGAMPSKKTNTLKSKHTRPGTPPSRNVSTQKPTEGEGEKKTHPQTTSVSGTARRKTALASNELCNPPPPMSRSFSTHTFILLRSSFRFWASPLLSSFCFIYF